MHPTEIDEEDRAAYHAAASIASNFLVTLEAAAEQLAGTAGASRELLVPLVRATVENWAAHGAAALTGPIARGDEATVARQRAAVAERTPELLPLFDAMAAGHPRPGERARHEDPAHQVRRSAPRCASRAARSARSASCRRWAPCTRATSRSSAARARSATRSSSRSSSTRRSSTRRSDLDAYPRDEAADAALAAEAGADLLFAPPADEVYPPGFATTVRVAGVTEPLEGEQRGVEHFDGVATVVTKLLNIVGPDVAYFGQKDAQQALVIRRAVTDLDLDVRIEVCPTVREPDGLALSSRNVRLDGHDRERALALHRALTAAETTVAGGERDAAVVTAAAKAAMDAFGVEPEYLAVVDANTLAPVAAIEDETLVAVAARVGETRLIDNTLISPNGRR